MLIDVRSADGSTYKAVGLPVKYGGTPASVTRPAPRLGEHTEEVIAEWLGGAPGARVG
jgi:crotonobetainyl-CoA:carnitine CoA-transferase CaiB-like acyl-CoA transferase